MDSERSLQRLRETLHPNPEQRDRVRARMRSRIAAPQALQDAKQGATPDRVTKQAIWQRVLSQIEPRAVAGFLDRLREMLTPSEEQKVRLRQRLWPQWHLAPYAPASQRFYKWAAALTIIVLVLRATPSIFLAPPSSADSSVILIPTSGGPLASVRGLWEPVTDEVKLSQGGQFKTEQGEATFLLNDDGNVRMGKVTQLMLHDVTNRPEPTLPGPTLTLEQGRIWVQGFVPQSIRGIVVATPAGQITVHEGSVSITVSDTVDVSVWDRHALITRENGRDLILVAGERVEIGDGAALVKKISVKEYEEGWAAQNLARDAVHRREIAQLQMERHAARAGILPTSPFYPVKRVAEAVDVLLTFDEQDRVEKQLQQASNRLDEATALIEQGGTGASVALDEYRSTLLSVATGSGQSSVTQFLLRQKLAEDAAQVAAALPDDSLYAVKRAVLEASAEMSDQQDISHDNVEDTFLLDTLDTLSAAAQAGDIARASEALATAQSHLDALQSDSGALRPQVRKEVLSVLSRVAEALREEGSDPSLGLIAEKEKLLQAVNLYLPAPAPVHHPISQEEADAIVQRIYDRVFTFKLPRSRWSQLMYEMKQIDGHPDEGLLLRQLYHKLPEQGLAQYVRTAIQEQREDQEAKGL